MEQLLEHHHLIDIPINKMQPILCNIRTCDTSLVRQMDRFLIKEHLVRTLSNYRQWVRSGGISNHSHIFLELLGPFLKPRATFKFNSTWLMDPKYIKLVNDFWRAHPPSKGRSTAEGFCHNLIEIKSLSTQWVKYKRYWDQ